MPFTDLFATPFESESLAFERLIEKYEPKILKTVSNYASDYARHLRGAADHDDLMQIARTAFWDANRLFDPTKVGTGKNPENVFIAFATISMKGRLSDYLRKLSKWKSRESLNDMEKTAFDFPDETLEATDKQVFAYLENYYSMLSPRERQYLHLRLLKDWETKQIAKATRVSENTVRSWKKSVRRKLQPLRESLMKGY